MPDIVVTVGATDKWMDTGVNINDGTATVTITATGTWTANPATPMVGPDGNPEYVGKPGYTIEGQFEGLLCGMVGTNGAFPIGASGAVPTQQTGELYLAINDDLNQEYGAGFPDNVGTLTVTIKVPG